MNLWKHPECYAGATWNGWLVFLSRNLDSSLLEQHNFDTALAVVKPLAIDVESEDACGVQVVRENHFLCGWVEWIAIHQSNAAAIQAAELLEAKLECYPILAEMAFSTRDQEEYCRQWESWGHRDFIRELERAELIQEDACADCTPEATREAFELLNPCGDYHEDGKPVIRRSVDRAKRDGLSDDVCRLLGLETEVA
jgi:hypothetical protein